MSRCIILDQSSSLLGCRCSINTLGLKENIVLLYSGVWESPFKLIIFYWTQKCSLFLCFQVFFCMWFTPVSTCFQHRWLFSSYFEERPLTSLYISSLVEGTQSASQAILLKSAKYEKTNNSHARRDCAWPLFVGYII